MFSLVAVPVASGDFGRTKKRDNSLLIKELSPSLNSGGIIWGPGDTLHELNIRQITP
jgi:hypothetical protein